MALSGGRRMVVVIHQRHRGVARRNPNEHCDSLSCRGAAAAPTTTTTMVMVMMMMTLWC
jgi:hypothetical protein